MTRDEEFRKACADGNGEFVQTFLAQSEEGINAADKQGNTGFILACLNGRRHVVEALLKSAKLDANLLGTGDGSADDEDALPGFGWAAFKGHVEVVEILLDADGVDYNLRSLRGKRTALFWACAAAREDVVEHLLARPDLVIIGSSRDRPNRSALEGAPKSIQNLVYAKLGELMQQQANLQIPARHIVANGVILGQGGFGQVQEGLYRKSTPVAIKRLVKAVNPDVMASFFNEVSAWRRVRHTNVLLLYGYCEDPPCIVSELAGDGNLLSYLRDCDWNDEKCFTMALEISRGMECMHSDNVIHGDLKPANVVVLHGHAKIGDFGLARFKPDNNTTTGDLSLGSVGTIGYMAPEVFDGKRPRKPSDVFSYGALCCEVFSRGKGPFEKKTDAVKFKISRPHDMTKEDVWLLVKKCLKINPADRDTFRSIVAFLTNICRREAPSAIGTTKRKRIERDDSSSSIEPAKKFVAASPDTVEEALPMPLSPLSPSSPTVFADKDGFAMPQSKRVKSDPPEQKKAPETTPSKPSVAHSMSLPENPNGPAYPPSERSSTSPGDLAAANHGYITRRSSSLTSTNSSSTASTPTSGNTLFNTPSPAPSISSFSSSPSKKSKKDVIGRIRSVIGSWFSKEKGTNDVEKEKPSEQAVESLLSKSEHPNDAVAHYLAHVDSNFDPPKVKRRIFSFLATPSKPQKKGSAPKMVEDAIQVVSPTKTSPTTAQEANSQLNYVTPGSTCWAKYPWVAENSDELTMEHTDLVEILTVQADGWGKARLKTPNKVFTGATEGMIPLNYVVEL